MYLLETPDGHEGQSTLPASDMPAGFTGASVVSYDYCLGQSQGRSTPVGMIGSTRMPCTLSITAAVMRPPCDPQSVTLPWCWVLQAGIVVFDGQTKYTSYEQWLADVDKHCVPPGTPYSWQPGTPL